MKAIWSFITFFLFTTGCLIEAESAMSQQFDEATFLKVTPEQRSAKVTDFMTSKLTLSAEQVTLVATVKLKFATAIDKILRSDDNKLSKARQAKNEFEEAAVLLKGILTNKQFQIFEAIKNDLIVKARSGKPAADSSIIN